MCLTGKSSLLSALGNRELPIPDHIDIYHLQHEMAPSDKTALQCVMDVDAERVRLEHEAEQLSTMTSDGTLTIIASLLLYLVVIVTLPLGRVRSIVMSLSVCLFVCIFVRSHNSKTTS